MPGGSPLDALAAPVAPLVAVDRPELAVLVGPRVPDRRVLLEIVVDVRRAAQEPQQLAHDRREQDLLRRDEREALAQVVAGLRAEQRDRAGAGAIGAALAVLEHVAEQIRGTPACPAYSTSPLTATSRESRHVAAPCRTPRRNRRQPVISSIATTGSCSMSTASSSTRRRSARRARADRRARAPQDAVRDRHQRRVAIARDVRRAVRELGLRDRGRAVRDVGLAAARVLRDAALAGARVCVLGTRRLDRLRARRPAATSSPLERGMEIDALAVCDDAGFAFLDGHRVVAVGDRSRGRGRAAARARAAESRPRLSQGRAASSASPPARWRC